MSGKGCSVREGLRTLYPGKINVSLFDVLQILKDVTNRYKLLRGYKIHYIPGWDCHGLPIEQKALAESSSDHVTMQPLDIRTRGNNHHSNSGEI